MAGGKETPRQKMIGMMYLVLTALLALNVSKQIIAAFITLNDKLDLSAEIINNKNNDTYGGFDQKRAALKATKGDTKLLDEWNAKADQLKAETAIIVGYLLSECNEMIKVSEGTDWVEETDDNGNIKKLKPLQEITGMDNYDIPTAMFVGGNPTAPIQRGLDIRLKVHEYRDKICALMGTYKQGKNNWTFTAPADLEGLSDACKSANPEDTAKIASFYRALTLPEELDAGHDAGMHPWVAVMFDHAPIVAAAAMFTSLKLDIKNAESMASEYMLSKVEAPVFNFNKIEPLAFARTGYINQGDSLQLSVMIAAYDSTEESTIRYGIDADTANPENWKETVGKIGLDGSKAGPHKVKGQIGVKEKGEITWKPWEFSYTVGQPMGVVALPEMRVLYWGYDNVVEGTASGFPPERVTLSGSGCSLSSKGNNQYVAKVSRGTRSAKISVSGKKEDGSSVSLGSFDFECRPMPNATVYFGKTEMGGTASYTAAKNQSNVRVGYDPSIPLTGVSFSILGGQVKVDGVPGTGKVLSGGSFDSKAKSLLNQSKGKTVTIVVDYKGPDGVGKKGGISFDVK